MKKYIPFLFIIISCSHRVTEYEFIYINFNRSHLDFYVENYSPIRVSMGKESVRFSYTGKYYFKVNETEWSFLSDTFHEEHAIKYNDSIPRERMGDLVLGIDFRKYKVGDTLNSWFHPSANIEDYSAFVYNVISKKEKIGKKEFVTIQQRWYNDDNKTLSYYVQYTYSLETHFLTESFYYYEMPSGFFGSNQEDTTELVMYRKKSDKNWTNVFTLDTMYLTKAMAEESANDAINDSLIPFYITVNRSKGGFINRDDIDAWDSLEVNLKQYFFSNPGYKIQSYQCIVMDSTSHAKPYGVVYGKKITDEIKTSALISGKGGEVIFYDIKVIDANGLAARMSNGPVFRMR